MLACLASCDEEKLPDAGADAAPLDASHVSDVTFTSSCDEAGLEEAFVPPIPPSCSPCPPTMPEAGSPCDAHIECEYGDDPRVGCNAMAVCGEPFPEAGLRWFDDPVTACGPLVQGTACTEACVDASVWCVGDGFFCLGPFKDGICQPIRDAALGCPCADDEASTAQFGSMICVDGRYVVLEMPLPPTH